MSSPLTGRVSEHRDDDGLVTLTLDDGGVNALDRGFLLELEAALNRNAHAPAIVLAGRAGVFSTGLNENLLRASSEDLHQALSTLGRALMRVWLEPRPMVAACTGHAIAAGALLAMACDQAVAADGEFRWGLNETRVGLAVPEFAISLARCNIRQDRLENLVLPGVLIGPAQAVDVGLADRLCAPEDVLEQARGLARELAELPQHAYRATKRRLRAMVVGSVIDRLDHDVQDVVSRRQD